jgi:hypothetical protein
MQQRAGRRGASAEAAATSLEFVGVAVAAALLVGGAALGLQARVPGMTGAIADVLGDLVEHGATRRSVRGVREVRAGGGDVRVRVSRDEIRMTPVLDPRALWQRGWSGEGSRTGVDASASISACAMCTGWEQDRGVVADPGEGGGLLGTVEGSARLALAAVQAQAAARRDLGSVGSVEATARARAMVGVEASGDGELRIGGGVDAEARGGVMVGAVAKAEGRAGMELFGVALEQTGSAEAWAGAGAKGVLGVHASQGRLQWRVGWGAALGIGGATEWNGAVDVSGVSAEHRRLARDALDATMAVTRFAVPALR